ncbi:glycosyltransferase family 2 protein [Mucilaginibacter calamicampi]|uniref:Glycosyltransferase family 2 protein n=1 Tax=Mucilaginibacter calamicampi TaxID=1302352 RepID=A0ABW2YWL6_9SPHI
MPAVSVIVPNYNHAPYLKQRIDSILAQSFQDFEVIILDDCSTDDSRSIIEQYRGHDKISHLVFNEQNSGGPFYQWKKGIELAQGKYIWIAESDDWCEPSLLETLVAAIDHNPECVMAYVQTHTVYNDEIIQTSSHVKLAEYIDGKQYIKKYLAGLCAIWNASMLLFKKEYYYQVSDSFINFKMCGDWQFYVELASQGEVFVSGKVLNYFRKHENDVSGKIYGTGQNYIEEIDILTSLADYTLITAEEFKQHLLDKYIRFLVSRHLFSTEMNAVIESKFYQTGGGKLKSFLIKESRRILIKARIKRRLNMLFDN